MADSTLAAIRTKVRRITKSSSTSNLLDSVLDEYINTFVLYDFPQNIQTLDLRKSFSFWTIPYVDTYPTLITLPSPNTINTPLYDFRNKYIAIYKPIYIDGNQAYFSQSEEEFYNLYPKIQKVERIGSGDGATTLYTGTLSARPVAQFSVSFRTISTSLISLVMQDVPVVDVNGYPTSFGNLVAPGTPYIPTTTLDASNNINYKTGEYTVTFSSAPLSGEDINVNSVPYVPSRPTALLYYGDTFVVRPIPEDIHQITFEVAQRPTELLSSSQNPEVNQWWQYIAYGAAKKVFEDRGDYESINNIMPEMKNQEILCMRKTVLQQSDLRTPTIYCNNNYNYPWGGFNNYGR